jgi:hypothetical protein
MNVINKIDKLLDEGTNPQGFKDTKELGMEIEDMDDKVEDKDVLKFQKILHKYLDKIDPKSNLSILQAVQKLGMNKGMKMYYDLLDLHYKG